MDAKRETEVFKLIDERSTAHVRELRDAYLKLKERIVELEAELAQEIACGNEAADRAVEARERGREDALHVFTAFLLKAGNETAKRALDLGNMPTEEAFAKLGETR